LQHRLDLQAREFLEEANDLNQHGRSEELRSLASSFMQHCAERVEDLSHQLHVPPKDEDGGDPEGEGSAVLGAAF
jgi:hypothetical protein